MFEKMFPMAVDEYQAKVITAIQMILALPPESEIRDSIEVLTYAHQISEYIDKQDNE